MLAIRCFFPFSPRFTASGATPLILAAMYNQHAIAKVLIKEGAELNAVVPDTGNTALYHAVGSGYGNFDTIVEP